MGVWPARRLRESEAVQPVLRYFGYTFRAGLYYTRTPRVAVVVPVSPQTIPSDFLSKLRS